MYNYGIRGSAYNLLKNYLTNKQQRVKLNNKTSQFESIKSHRLLYWDRYYLYCISTTYYYNSIVCGWYCCDLNSENMVWSWAKNELLLKISKYVALNKLSLNTDKTVYMEFSSQCDNTPKNLNININGIKIKREERYQIFRFSLWQ